MAPHPAVEPSAQPDDSASIASSDSGNPYVLDVDDAPIGILSDDEDSDSTDAQYELNWENSSQASVESMDMSEDESVYDHPKAILAERFTSGSLPGSRPDNQEHPCSEYLIHWKDVSILRSSWEYSIVQFDAEVDYYYRSHERELYTLSSKLRREWDAKKHLVSQEESTYVTMKIFTDPEFDIKKWEAAVEEEDKSRTKRRKMRRFKRHFQSVIDVLAAQNEDPGAAALREELENQAAAMDQTQDDDFEMVDLRGGASN